MRVILLPGQHISNKEWIENVEKKFQEKFTNTKISYYDHWEKGEERTDIELETKKFLDIVNSSDEEYILFAKSIGSIIFFNSLKDLVKKPKGVLIVGIAYNLAKELNYDFTNLKEYISYPVNIYQKEFDPAGYYADIMSIDGGNITVNQYECVGEENNNHSYENYDYLLELLDNLVE